MDPLVRRLFTAFSIPLLVALVALMVAWTATAVGSEAGDGAALGVEGCTGHVALEAREPAPSGRQLAPAPALGEVLTISSVLPATVVRGTTVVLRVLGSGFAEGGVLRTVPANDLDVLRAVVRNTREIQVDLSVTAGASLGTRGVRWENPDLQSAELAAAFEVIDSPAAERPLAFIANTFDQANTVTVIDTSSREVVAEVAVDPGPQAIEWHPDRTRVYVACNGDNGLGNTIQVIDTSTFTVTDTIELPHGGPEGMEMRPDGTRLYVATAGVHILPPDGINDYLTVVDLTTHQAIADVEVGDHPWDVALSPDGRTLYVPNAHHETVMFIDEESLTIIDEVNLGDGLGTGVDHHPAIVEVHPNGRELWVANMHSDVINVIDIASHQLLRTWSMRDPDCPPGVRFCEHSMGLAFTPDGSKVFIGLYFANEVSVYDTATYSEVARLPGFEGPKSLGMHPDGGTVWVANTRGATAWASTVTVLDTTTLATVETIQVGLGPHVFGRIFGSVAAQ